jgi:hypothetical protein
MLLKANWRAWQRRLNRLVVVGVGRGDGREVAGGFFVFGLFFGEKAGQGYDVDVDGFGADAGIVVAVGFGGHLGWSGGLVEIVESGDVSN